MKPYYKKALKVFLYRFTVNTFSSYQSNEATYLLPVFTFYVMHTSPCHSLFVWCCSAEVQTQETKC